MSRKKRPLERASGVVRDASLIVVACEDTHVVKQYFKRFRTRKVQFVVLSTEDGRSSPRSVLDRLDKFRDEEATEEGDQLWICIDTDHWVRENHIPNLMQVLRECRQKGYESAISNPCFELWLLLHFRDHSPDEATCDDIVRALRATNGAYQKNKCHLLQIDASNVAAAVERARKMDTGYLPATPGTQVYQLIEVLKSRDAIDLN